MTEIVFTFDNTLADTTTGMVVAVQGAFRQNGLFPPTRLQIAKHMNEDLAQAINVWTRDHLTDPEKLIFDIETAFSEVGSGLVRLYPKVDSTLKKLTKRGFTLTLLETSDQSRKLQPLGIGDYFSNVIADLSQASSDAIVISVDPQVLAKASALNLHTALAAWGAIEPFSSDLEFAAFKDLKNLQ